MTMVTNLRIILNVSASDIFKNNEDVCLGVVEYATPGFPGEIHIKEAVGTGPNEGQKVLIIPIEE